GGRVPGQADVRSRRLVGVPGAVAPTGGEGGVAAFGVETGVEQATPRGSGALAGRAGCLGGLGGSAQGGAAAGGPNAHARRGPAAAGFHAGGRPEARRSSV